MNLQKLVDGFGPNFEFWYWSITAFVIVSVLFGVASELIVKTLYKEAGCDSPQPPTFALAFLFWGLGLIIGFWRAVVVLGYQKKSSEEKVK